MVGSSQIKGKFGLDRSGGAEVGCVADGVRDDTAVNTVPLLSTWLQLHVCAGPYASAGSTRAAWFLGGQGDRFDGHMALLWTGLG